MRKEGVWEWLFDSKTTEFREYDEKVRQQLELACKARERNR